jgi:hypothetical protein
MTYLIIKSLIFFSPRPKTSNSTREIDYSSIASIGEKRSSTQASGARACAGNRACLINVRVPVERIRISRDQAARDRRSDVSNSESNGFAGSRSEVCRALRSCA